MDVERLGRFIEFLLIGIIMGVTEDVIAIAVTTDAEIKVETVGIVILVAIPFAIVSELVVDQPTFEYFERVAERLTVAR